jgi:hypothetical protein
MASTKLLVSYLENIYKKYDIKHLFPLSTDTSICIQIKEMSVVSPLNDIYYNWLYDTRMMLS